MKHQYSINGIPIKFKMIENMVFSEYGTYLYLIVLKIKVWINQLLKEKM